MASPNDFALDGAHALVTGGGTGIGAAIAQALDGAGARVSIMGRREGPLQETAATLSNPAGIATADVTDGEGARKAIAELAASHGQIACLVSNAGAAESAPFVRMEQSLWDHMIGVNLTGVFNTTQGFVSQLDKETPARIISIASIAGLMGVAYVTAYCAAKHGVIGLTRALAREMATRPVTVNAVCPGYVETPLLEESIARIMAKTDLSEEDVRASMAGNNPQGRIISSDEVAETVLWLCNPNSGSVTGQAIAISGGEI